MKMKVTIDKGTKTVTRNKRGTRGRKATDKRKRDESRGRQRRITEKKDRRCIAVEVSQDGTFRGVFQSLRGAARAFGLNDKAISDCLCGRRKELEGYTFTYHVRPNQFCIGDRD